MQAGFTKSQPKAPGPVKQAAPQQEHAQAQPISFSTTVGQLSIQRTCACGGACPTCRNDLPIQPKLTIGAPNDKYEQEADRVADQVMRVGALQLRGQAEAEEVDSEYRTELIAPYVRDGAAPQEGREILQSKHAPGRNLEVSLLSRKEGDSDWPRPRIGALQAMPAISRQTRDTLSAEEILVDRKLAGYSLEMNRLIAEKIPGGEDRIGVVRQGVVEIESLLDGPAALDEKKSTLAALESALAPVLPGASPVARPSHGVIAQRLERPGFEEPRLSPGLTTRVNALRGVGSPLSPLVRARFESWLGYDFSRIRVHTDEGAARLARSLGAVAFTIGGDIAFDHGQYAPGSQSGDRLLAHELTHAVQQGAAPPVRFAAQSKQQRSSTVTERGMERVSRQLSTQCAGTNRWPGNNEHLFIESWYTSVINPSFGEAEFAIPNANESGSGTGYADLVDTLSHSVFEIKPWWSRANGVAQVERYRDAAQLFCDPDVLWFLGMLYPFTVFPMSATHDLVSTISEFPGVIGYWYRVRVPPPVPVPKKRPKPYRLPEPKPVPWWVPVGAALAYLAWNSKGCLAGPWGCVIDWATPGI